VPRHSKLVGFVATANLEARSFYRDALGFSLAEGGPFALAFDANGTRQHAVADERREASWPGSA